jgi:hypothetical protein
MSYALGHGYIKYVWPNGQKLLLNLRQVTRVYTENKTVVFVTTESTIPRVFLAPNKTVNKKVFIDTPTIEEANAVFTHAEKCMSRQIE